MRAFLYFLFVSLAIICNSCQSSVKENSITISLIHLNDVYEISGVNKGKEGGYARLAYLVDSLKKQNPNTLVVHAGDFLSPSLIGNLKDDKNQKIKGRQMIEVMNAAKVDVVTFGNHEFDIKEHELLSRIDESKFLWVSANVFHRKDSAAVVPFRQNGKEMPRAYQKIFVQNNDTFKLGIVGVTLPFNHKKYVNYKDVQNTLKEVLDTISTDKTVLLTHLERAQDQGLAKSFQDILLIMGGHDHYHFMDTIGSVYVAKADANLRTVWKHDLTYNFDTKKLEIKSELIKLDVNVMESPTVLKVVNKWKKFARKKALNQGFELNKVVWEGDSVWECRETIIRSQQTNFGNMVARAMKKFTKADLVLLNSGSLRYDDQLTQVITHGDILKALPFGGKVVVSKINGMDLEKIFKVGLELNSGTGGYLQIPDVQIVNGTFFVKGEKLEWDKEYLVCTSEFMSAGKETNLQDLGKYSWDSIPSKSPNDIRNLVVYYLELINQNL